MPRLLSSYAANKRVEDGLRRKQEQIRLDYIRATHRHLDETEKLVDDLIHINVRTPSAFEIRPPLNSGNLVGHHSAAASKPSSSVINSGQHHNIDHDQHSITSGVSPANFRTELASGKVPGHPLIQVRGNEVFYQYQKQPKNWKKVEPSYKTKLLLHRNDAVIKALNNFNNCRNEELSEKNSSEDRSYSNSNSNAEKRKSSVMSDTVRRDSLFQRRRSRRESRISFERKDSIPTVLEIPPQLSPGHTPRMLDGWRIMKWCLWNKQETTPVWATRRYADMKQREYQKFITGRKRSEEKAKEAKEKPSSAKTTSSRQEQQQGKEGTRRPSVPRAKSVPVGRISVTTADEAVSEHFPSIDRGVIRPTTSILRTSIVDSDTATYEDEARPKTTSRRRVALDTFPDDPKDLFTLEPCNNNNDNNKDTSDVLYLSGHKASKSAGKTVNYDGRSVTICTWDTLAETDKESSAEEYD